MRISSIEEYLQQDEIEDPSFLDQIHLKFPHVVVVELDYPELDVSMRWCWRQFGAMDGECMSSYSEYPACPLVLATEHTPPGANQRKRYQRVAEHSHVGIWTLYWLGKTDYDHGFGEFCFRDAPHAEEFARHVPEFDWGENHRG